MNFRPLEIPARVENAASTLLRSRLQWACLGLPLALALLTVRPALADTIYLNDERSIIGMVDEAASDDARVAIRNSTGLLMIPRSKINRIEQEESLSVTESSGDEAAANGKLDTALNLYKKALAADADNARVQQKIEDLEQRIEERDVQFYGTAFADVQKLLENQQYAQAIERGTELLGRVKEDAAAQRVRRIISEAHLGIARQHRDRVAYPDAERHFELAIQVDPQNPTPYLELASMFQTSPARQDAAIPLYTKGIALAEQHPDVVDAGELLEYRFALGQLYMGQRSFTEAADSFLQIMRMDDSMRFPQAVDLAMDAYSRIQITSATTDTDLSGIIRNLDTVIQLDPNEQRAYLLLGRIYFDRNNYEQARAMLEQAVANAGMAAAPTQDALYYLGMTYHKLGDLEKAAQALTRLAAERGSSYDSTAELGEVRLDQRDYAGALQLFQQAIAIDGDRYRGWLGMGEALQRLGRYDEARDAYSEVVERDPSNTRAQLQIAQSYADEERYDEAVRESEKVLDLIKTALNVTTGSVAAQADQLDDDMRDVLAQTYTLMGTSNVTLNKPNLARENFEQALTVKPEFPPAFEGIGKTYQADGLHNRAEEFFQKAIDADPSNPNFYLSMGINWHKYRKNPERALPYYYRYIELGGNDPNVRSWIKEVGGTVPETMAAGAAGA